MDNKEISRNGFKTSGEVHPSEIVNGGDLNGQVGIKELRDAIPAHCFTPSPFWSFFYLFRDLTYSSILLYGFFQISEVTKQEYGTFFYYPLMMAYGFAQGIVWTGLWIIAHECGHSAFTTNSVINDSIGWILHSFLLAPYFSWKSTHRRHHIYAGHLEKDLVYVPPRRETYAAKLGLDAKNLEELGEDAPIVLFLRILLQQAIGWNWYILSNITCPPGALLKQGMSIWRHSHFDPWGSLFRSSEIMSILLSDLGCFVTLSGLFLLRKYLGSWEQVFWLYIVPWSWVNHWIVMITYLHHTHPTIPKYSPESWTFILGATATMDRDFGIIGSHFFHNISSHHVIHHLFSKVPHYYAPEATDAIVPLLGRQYHGRGAFGWADLKLAFGKCQWVEEDAGKDLTFFGGGGGGKDVDVDVDVDDLIGIKESVGMLHDAGEKRKKSALWYRGGPSPSPEYRMRDSDDGVSKIEISEKSVDDEISGVISFE